MPATVFCTAPVEAKCWLHNDTSTPANSTDKDSVKGFTSGPGVTLGEDITEEMLKQVE